MMILNGISRFVSEIVGLFDLIVGGIVKGIFFLFKLWFDYLVNTISLSGMMSVFATMLLITTILLFLGALYFLVKYLSIYILIVLPIAVFLLKYIIMAALIIFVFIAVKRIINEVKVKLKGDEEYV